MTNKKVVLGIDTGHGNQKSANTCFPTAIAEVSTQPALTDNILEVDGKYYSLTSERMGLRTDKTEDDNFYLLTLVSIAKELKFRGLRSADIYLAIGVAPARFGAEKDQIKKYMMRKSDISFKFEGQLYHIHIEKISVFPQAYSAIVSDIANYKRKQYVVDLGSLTLDIIPIVNYTYSEADCITLNQGVISCISAVNKECVRQFGYEIDELDIREIMITGESTLPQKVVIVIKKVITDYVNKILKVLLENGINVERDRITFVGGGATIIKRYANINSPNITYKLDICANAKGYELLMKKSIER
ncbi:MAG: ParM/StbA family protein [Lachnospiraceae bacterium]|nr:ParM/StbA family protein [Lachnospiraceae bacterium]